MDGDGAQNATSESKLPLWAIDLLGAVFVSGCLVMLAWLVLFQASRTVTTTTLLGQHILAARTDFSEVQASCQAQEELLAAQRIELETNGHLPETPPIEEYFRTLSSLAAQHGLRVVRNMPLSARTYPGLLEQQYEYEVTGTTSELMAFLEAVEATDFWADIGYLKISAPARATAQTSPDRIGKFTFSLFSALPSVPQGKSG